MDKKNIDKIRQKLTEKLILKTSENLILKNTLQATYLISIVHCKSRETFDRITLQQTSKSLNQLKTNF